MQARIVALAAMAGVAACGPTAPSTLPPTPLTLSLVSDGWQTISDPQPYPLTNTGASLTFDFPSDGSMNYLFTPSPLAAIRGTLMVTLTVTTTGSARFELLDPGDCSIPTSVRPFFWANNNGGGEYDRWWSNPIAATLGAGSSTISVPLTGASWSSVNGRYGNADGETAFNFEKALLNVTRLGVTFGGGCSFGHGVRVSGGTARFALNSYAVQ